MECHFNVSLSGIRVKRHVEGHRTAMQIAPPSIGPFMIALCVGLW
ncbi:MAG TPA: hypothetical protein VLA29_02485 [Acidimicrobiia bacterium]|nr:hypothetical protein [Acidimicrobiia bacterium]